MMVICHGSYYFGFDEIKTVLNNTDSIQYKIIISQIRSNCTVQFIYTGLEITQRAN